MRGPQKAANCALNRTASCPNSQHVAERRRMVLISTLEGGRWLETEFAGHSYADDFVILCRREAEAQSALATVRAGVSAAGLSLPDRQARTPAATLQKSPAALNLFSLPAFYSM